MFRQFELGQFWACEFRFPKQPGSVAADLGLRSQLVEWFQRAAGTNSNLLVAGGLIRELRASEAKGEADQATTNR